ncbi:Uncharacterised protein [Vibrio cholerae]|nr:Uncharacterised protein [Vibrio cholerae]CSB60695.1 Uncharacterised protein [Vibrio cholerae]CSB63986.1 Uncharacterised protein [Vibrio cholerae]CSI41549.1 Uncharacterised protein [Vibrio cholerae]
MTNPTQNSRNKLPDQINNQSKLAIMLCFTVSSPILAWWASTSTVSSKNAAIKPALIPNTGLCTSNPHFCTLSWPTV